MSVMEDKDREKEKLERQCTDRCQSTQHGALVNAIARKGNDRQVVTLWSQACSNYGHVKDAFGRSALHAAACTPNVKAVEWLLQNEGAKINAKEFTSGYTPLHRSIFCGQLSVARTLVQHGANLAATDNEGLTPLALYLIDRETMSMSSSKDFRVKADPTEVYTWGTNVNFNLGTGNTSARVIPEPLEMFGSLRVSQVVLQCFHSTFLSQNGEVFTCGVGRGGRLGLGNEATALRPTKVNLASNFRCVQVAAGSDHTLFLMENGEVHGCGSNANSVLGLPQDPDTHSHTHHFAPKRCPVAKVEGVRTSDFHTVFFSSTKILTCGRNYGQLGHPLKVLANGLEKFGTPMQTPASVPRLHLLDTTHVQLKITQCECNELATVLLSTNIYVLYNFELTRIDTIYAGFSEIVKIGVTGGRLDGLPAKGADLAGENFISTILKSGGPAKRSIRDRGNSCPLTIILLNASGNIIIWRENLRPAKQGAAGTVGKFFETTKSHTTKLEGTFTKICFGIGRQIPVSDFFITREQILLASADGEAFQGRLNCCEPPITFKSMKEEENANAAAATAAANPSPGAYKEFSFKTNSKKRSQHNFATLSLECVKVRRIPNVHAAVSIMCDPKGKSFAIIQRHHRSDYITVPTISPSVMNENMEYLYRSASLDDDLHDVVFEVMSEHDIKIQFPAHKFIIASGCSPLYNEIKNAALNSESYTQPTHVFVHNTVSHIFEQVLQYIYFNRCDWIAPGFTVTHFGNSENSHANAANLISKMAKYCRSLDLKHLVDKLKNVQIVDDVVCLRKPEAECYHSQCNTKVFDPNGYQTLTDMTLVTNDKREIKVHKCVLYARMDHFRMLWAGSTWNDSNATTLKIPTSYHGTKLLIDYLYTDALPDPDKHQSSVDGRPTALLEEKLTRVDKAIEALATSDYFFLNEFRSRAELRLYEMISLKNVSKILTVATFLNAEQLQNSCYHFIALNFAHLLENRFLDDLTSEIMAAATQFYQSLNVQVASRLPKPDSELMPCEDAYEEALAQATPEFDLFLQDFDEYMANRVTLSKSTNSSLKTAARRRRQNSRNYSESEESQAQNVTQMVPLSAEFAILPGQEKEKGKKLESEQQKRVRGPPPTQIPITKETPSISIPVSISRPTSASAKANSSVSPAHKMSPLKSSTGYNGENYTRPKIEEKQHPRTLSSELSSSFEEFPTLSSAKEPVTQKTPPAPEKSATEKPVNDASITSSSAKKKIKWKTVKDVAEIGKTKKPEPESPCIAGTSRERQNPWNRNRAQANEHSHSNGNEDTSQNNGGNGKKLNFKEILRDEQEKEDNWKKLTSKSLHLMQIEETAINQLTRFYRTEDTVDGIELLTIERVQVTNVGKPPCWPPQQSQHASPSTSSAIWR